MDYKIIVDTGCDITEELVKEYNISSVPFRIAIDSEEFRDDENLNIQKFIETMVESKNPIRTSCPSPFDYLEKLKDVKENNIFIMTITSKLSGSYQSACIAARDFAKENPDKNIYVLDSKTAAAGGVAMLLKMVEIIKEKTSFEEKVEKLIEKTNELKTYIVLESLENLVKNGRIRKASGLIANVLNIRPIMYAVDGEIELFEMNRGFKRAINKITNKLGELIENLEDKNIVISHVNAIEKASELEKSLREKYKFKNLLIVQSKGLSSGYADNGGIVLGIV